MTRLSYLYLARFPLLLAALVAGYGVIAHFVLPRFLQSSLVVDVYGIRHVAFVATLAAITVMLTRHIVILYGPIRFQVPEHPAKRPLSVLRSFGYVALVAPLIAAIVINSRGQQSALELSVWAATGIAAALVVFWLVIALQYVFVRPDHQSRDALLPFRRLRTMLRSRDRVPHVLRRQATRVASSVGLLLGPGYANAADGALLPYHGLALSMMAAWVVAYALYYWYGAPGTDSGASTPALAYLLVLATAWTWLLAGAAFFFDRYRVPVGLLVVAWSAAVSMYARSDHYFQHTDARGTVFASPAAIARANDDAPLIVVAADGGGIQAAAWTARVLSEIQRAWPDFARSLRLVSSVSGSGVGAMYFIGVLDREHPPSPDRLREVVALAERGGINETWWGWAYPDFWRTLLPIPPSQRFIKDRAWALERAWARSWDAADTRLSDLAAQAAEGIKPAIAFNATVVEDGRRLLIASFEVPERWRVASFHRLFEGRDVDVVTAARLSATFPYVTPVSRAWPDSQDRAGQHFADGAYYDNTGMLTALQWLGDVFEASPERYQGRPVAVIRVASFPDFDSVTVKDRSTWYQLIAPLVAQFAVSRTGQVDRMNTELEQFTKSWCSQGIEVVPFTFQFRADSPPFTWSLTPSQRAAIGDEWNSEANQTTLRRLVQTMMEANAAEAPPDACPHGGVAG